MEALIENGQHIKSKRSGAILKCWNIEPSNINIYYHFINIDTNKKITFTHRLLKSRLQDTYSIYNLINPTLQGE